MKTKLNIPTIRPLLAYIALALFSTLVTTGCNQQAPTTTEAAAGHHADDETHAHDDSKTKSAAASKSAASKDDHAHDDHDDHAHGDHDDHAHDHDHDHDHPRIEDGPNGGRLLTMVEPHIELFVMKDRKIQLTAVGDDDKAIDITDQTASAIGGSRTKPTRLKFTKQGSVLVSDLSIPDGLDVPLVITITPKKDADSITEKLQLNMRDCPSCDNLEYACTCDHAH